MLDFFPDLRQIRYNSFNNLKQEVNVRLFNEILLRFGCCFAIYIVLTAPTVLSNDSLLRFENAHVGLSPLRQMLSQFTG